MKDERNMLIIIIIPFHYTFIFLNLAVYCYFNRLHLYKMVILDKLVVVAIKIYVVNMIKEVKEAVLYFVEDW